MKKVLVLFLFLVHCSGDDPKSPAEVKVTLKQASEQEKETAPLADLTQISESRPEAAVKKALSAAVGQLELFKNNLCRIYLDKKPASAGDLAQGQVLKIHHIQLNGNIYSLQTRWNEHDLRFDCSHSGNRYITIKEFEDLMENVISIQFYESVTSSGEKPSS